MVKSNELILELCPAALAKRLMLSSGLKVVGPTQTNCMGSLSFLLMTCCQAKACCNKLELLADVLPLQPNRPAFSTSHGRHVVMMGRQSAIDC